MVQSYEKPSIFLKVYILAKVQQKIRFANQQNGFFI